MIRTVLALSMGFVMGTLSLAERPTTPGSVRVMSFNIRFGTAADGENHWEKRKQFLADTIAAFDPDLLGTQETLASQRDFLAEKLRGYDAHAAGRDDGHDAGEMAALFYRAERFAKLDGGHFWLSETPDQPGSKGWDAALPRIASWVKLTDRTRPDAPPILFMNAHLDHRGAESRRQATALIRKQAVALGAGCRVVITGDFNAGEGSAPYKELFGEESPFFDAYRVRHPARAAEEGTFTAFKPTATRGDRIDWIACSRDFTITEAAIDRTSRDGRVPSDHFPVTAVLTPRE